MMDIKVIISGNLTGFSRFYLSPGASEVMAESRFKFDTYSYLMFLRPGGKVYSISFAREHIAASVITPILDSFRRPGTLVVSVLIPRNQKVERVLEQDNNRALYDLLTDLNDRFYEKNYKDGMINQNPAVLMQDYYSDIISRYTYVPDLNQKAININIDTEALTRKPGYVASAESNIPAYLSNLCRRSYEGFHYVFISPDAPQNIDEEPEEVLLYRVRIINKNMFLPEPVRLTQNIYPMQPGEGELDFDKNYTYQQVLSGQCPQISAVLTGETIEINYRFRQQEKKIRFEFYDEETNAPVDISLIRPSVESGSVSRVLTSDSCIFLGPEIYSRLTIISKGSGYHMIDSVVDLRYISDRATVRMAVSQGCRIQKIFNAPYDMPKTITLKSYTGEHKVLFNVTDALNEKISGQISDWTYEITAEGYETTKGYLASLLNDASAFRMTPKSSAGSNTMSPGSALVDPGAPKIFNGDASFGGNRGTKRPKGLNWKKIAAVALAGIALILGIVVVTSVIKHKKEKAEAEQQITIVVDFEFKDKDNKDISAENARDWGFFLTDADSDEAITFNKADNYTYEVTALFASDAVLRLNVEMLEVVIGKSLFEKSFIEIKQEAGEGLKYTYTIELKLSNDEITKIYGIYSDLKKVEDKITDQQYNDISDAIKEVSSNEFKVLLNNLLSNKSREESLRTQDNSIEPRFNHLGFDFGDFSNNWNPKNEASKKRKEAIIRVLNYVLEKKPIKDIPEELINSLSDIPQEITVSNETIRISQQDVIKRLKALGNKPEETQRQIRNKIDSLKEKPEKGISFYTIYTEIILKIE